MWTCYVFSFRQIYRPCCNVFALLFFSGAADAVVNLDRSGVWRSIFSFLGLANSSSPSLPLFPVFASWVRRFSSSYSRMTFPVVLFVLVHVPVSWISAISIGLVLLCPWCRLHLVVLVPTGCRWLLLIFALRWFWGVSLSLSDTVMLATWHSDLVGDHVCHFLFPIGGARCSWATVLAFAIPGFLCFILVLTAVAAW